ncbi:J domain-containing protein [Phenylobacterium montanum]|uniref:DnaJ domain-containing protein n=1 Tax=Phenylobacterium montanum TaxID=2823693 RepID=A0A975FWD6_9CAUL|nr:J domain-containing protein [Caulobacter sp. S6]QUD86361.1 DnaJ domain-containing protein [Caulobacter sp. S6]
MATHYETLGVSPTAEPEVIQAAYRALMRKYHPDTNGGAGADAQAKRISEAYATLSDLDRRAAYDLRLRAKARSERAAADASPSASPPDRAPPPNLDRRRAKQWRNWGLGALSAIALAGMGLAMAIALKSPAGPSEAGSQTVAAAASGEQLAGGSTFYLAGMGDEPSFELLDLSQSRFKPHVGGTVWTVVAFKTTKTFPDGNRADYMRIRYEINCDLGTIAIKHVIYSDADGSVSAEKNEDHISRVKPETVGSNIANAICASDYSGLTKVPQTSALAILKHVRERSRVVEKG